MKVLAIEHSRIGYFIDSVFYLAAVLLLSGFILLFTPSHTWFETTLYVVAGLAIWSLLEYAMHRFVLHRIDPFRRLHDEHHRQPQALLATPTLLSAVLIIVFVFLPATLLGNLPIGCGITLGVTTGYFAFGVVHYAVHHSRLHGTWLIQCRRLHAQHHRFPDRHFGVTMTIWDRIFRTDKTGIS